MPAVLSPTKPSLKTEKVSKHFDGIYAVKDFSIELFPGQITGVIGPNGSGKTTFINLITGRYFSDGGTITLPSGKRTRHLKTHRAAPHGVARTFQTIKLFNQMSVQDNLFNVLTPRNPFGALFFPRSQGTKHRVAALLHELGLYEKRKEPAGNLSYGQRKLLEIGRALLVNDAHSPRLGKHAHLQEIYTVGTCEVYCFDEPFAGLFPAMVEKVKAMFLKLKAQGKCIIWVEHNINLIKELSDRVLFMDNGKLLADGPAKEVFELPEVLEAYLGK
jgi:ABC-type branched-subunit amino acid transport system ATPase component